jgi:GINS complex subunit 2
VPLWLAIQLKKNKKCQVIPPIWMDYEQLNTFKTKEKDNEFTLQELPYYFYEISQILFHK